MLGKYALQVRKIKQPCQVAMLDSPCSQIHLRSLPYQQLLQKLLEKLMRKLLQNLSVYHRSKRLLSFQLQGPPKQLYCQNSKLSCQRTRREKLGGPIEMMQAAQSTKWVCRNQKMMKLHWKKKRYEHTAAPTSSTHCVHSSSAHEGLCGNIHEGC